MAAAPTPHRRRTVPAVLWSLLPVLVAACGGLPSTAAGPDGVAATSAPTTPAPPAAEPVPACDPSPAPRDRLVLWHPFVDHDVHRRALDAALDGYRQGRPEVRVESLAVEPGELTARLGSASPEELPDLVLASNRDLLRLADSGRTVPIESCRADVGGPDPDRFWPAVRQSWTFHDRLWAAPYRASVPLLWVNRAELDAVGLPVPTDRTELDAVLRAVHGRTGRPALRYDLELAPVLVERWASQRGRPLVRRDGDGRVRVGIDRPDVRADLTWLRDLDHAGVVATDGSEESVDDLRSLVDAAGPTALAVHSSASTGLVIEELTQGGIDPEIGDLAEVPAERSGTTAEPRPDGLGLFVMAGRRTDPPAAAALAAFLTEPGPQAAAAAIAGHVPTAADALDRPELTDALHRQPRLRVAIDRVAALRPAPEAPPRPGIEPEVRRALIEAYRSIRQGCDPQVALDGAQRVVDHQLRLYESAHGR